MSYRQMLVYLGVLQHTYYTNTHTIITLPLEFERYKGKRMAASDEPHNAKRSRPPVFRLCGKVRVV